MFITQPRGYRGAVDTESRAQVCEPSPERNQTCQIPWLEVQVPEKQTVERARKDAAEGKAPSTQAGEFVREEMDHIREGKHGARSAKQAIAIGLSKARRAGVQLTPPKKGKSSAETRRRATRENEQRKQSPRRPPSPRRSRATTAALKREGRQAASPEALSRQAKTSARNRGPASRRGAAQKAARTRRRSTKR